MNEDNKKPENIVVETFAGDMAEVIESDRAGLIKKIIEGEEEREAEKKNQSPESKRNKLFLGISALLLFLGAGTLFYFLENRKVNVLPAGQEFAPMIFTEKSAFVEVGGLKKHEIIETILNQAHTEVKPWGIVAMYLTLNQKVMGLRQFISLMESSFAPDEKEELVSENFLLGKVQIPRGADSTGLFLMIKMRSLSDIFASLRAWEGKMLYDLKDLFGIALGSENSYLLASNFEDGIVENQNARLLYDRDGNLVLFYVFADNTSVIIADSPLSAREVMRRLQAKRTEE